MRVILFRKLNAASVTKPPAVMVLWQAVTAGWLLLVNLGAHVVHGGGSRQLKAYSFCSKIDVDYGGCLKPLIPQRWAFAPMLRPT